MHDQAAATATAKADPEVEAEQEPSGSEGGGIRISAGVSYRRPTQARGRKKFEAILDAAHELIDRNGTERLSLYDVAQEASVATGSVYHFFPSTESIFGALVDRYDKAFIEDVLARPIPPGSIQTWMDLMRVIARTVHEHYARNRPAMLLLLARSGHWPTNIVTARGKDAIADGIVKAMRRFFIVPDQPDPHEVIARGLRVTEGLWRLSVYRHGLLTNEFMEEGARAMIAYVSLYIPPYLAPAPDGPLAAASSDAELESEADDG